MSCPLCWLHVSNHGNLHQFSYRRGPKWQRNFPPSPKHGERDSDSCRFNQSGYIFCVAEIRYRELPLSHCPRCSRVELSRKAGKKKNTSAVFADFSAFFLNGSKKGQHDFSGFEHRGIFFCWNIGTLDEDKSQKKHHLRYVYFKLNEF